MKKRTKVIIGITGIILLASAAALQTMFRGDRGVDVRIEETQRRDLVEVVTEVGISGLDEQSTLVLMFLPELQSYWLMKARTSNRDKCSFA